ncbi:MAG: GntR family transcriptional regulator [Proteobacteria bacterium]|nr:GntR family transcriptional regulator [Pseudomonadota bacterium]
MRKATTVHSAQKHEIVVDSLAKDIFLGKLKPDTKLPTVKNISEEMHVDCTSVRLGLKQLESMKVLSIRQGDGIYVNDYLKNAGVDFLGFTFQKLEEDSANLPIDGYLLDEIWEFWILFWPPVLELAAKRASARDIKLLVQIIDQQEACINTMNRKKMAKLLISLQDTTAEVVNNSILLLMFNSCRPFRIKIIEMLFDSMDKAELHDVVTIQRIFLQKVVKGSEGEITEALDALRESYMNYRQRMRELMSSSIAVRHTDKT